jgi:hypothetical protein
MGEAEMKIILALRARHFLGTEGPEEVVERVYQEYAELWDKIAPEIVRKLKNKNGLTPLMSLSGAMSDHAVTLISESEHDVASRYLWFAATMAGLACYIEEQEILTSEDRSHCIQESMEEALDHLHTQLEEGVAQFIEEVGEALFCPDSGDLPPTVLH